MNRIKETIEENMESFDKHVPPVPNFGDVEAMISAGAGTALQNKYYAEQEYKMRLAIRENIRTHLIDSQHKLLNVLVEELEGMKKRNIDLWEDESVCEIPSFYYGGAIDDVITLIKEARE